MVFCSRGAPPKPMGWTRAPSRSAQVPPYRNPSPAMSDFNVEPLAEAVRALRSQINQALAEFDKATGGAVGIDVSVGAAETTTLGSGVRTYRHYAGVCVASVEVT